MRFKIDWASLIVGSKFTVFALSYFVFEGNFPSTSPPGANIWRSDLMAGFLRYRFGGLIFGGGLYMERLIFGILRYVHKSLFLELSVHEGNIKKSNLFCSALFSYCQLQALEINRCQKRYPFSTKTLSWPNLIGHFHNDLILLQPPTCFPSSNNTSSNF